MNLQDAKDAVRVGVGDPNPDYVDALAVYFAITWTGIQSIGPNPNPYLAWARNITLNAYYGRYFDPANP